MIRSLNIYFIALCITLVACKGNIKTPENQTEKKDTEMIKSEPDNADLLKVLQGKWQSNQDPNYIIEVIGNRMLHQNNGQPTLETSIEADATCSNAACKIEGADTSDGWCFIEIGQDTQCNLVLKCDKTQLHYRALGATKDLAFTQVN